MTGSENISLIVALSGGLISFLSPCILPLVPSYVAFITGISIEELSSEKNLRAARKKVVLSALFFILGFSLVFIALGASATFIGKFLSRHIRWFEIGGGILIIILGLHFAGFLRLRFLDRERTFHMKKKPLGYLGTVLVGVAFAAGWTPCVGPILGSILALAATTQDTLKGILLLSAYSIGLGLPFFLSAVILHRFFEFFSSMRKYFKVITVVGGLLLVAVGVMLLTGYFSRLSYLLL